MLDGAYPVTGGSPWYPSSGPAMRSAFDAVCRRSAVCATIPGSSPARLDASGRGSCAQGRAPDIAPSDLAFVMDSAGLDPLAYRDLDAAARAFLDAGDAVPLDRLVREAYAYEEGAGRRGERVQPGTIRGRELLGQSAGVRHASGSRRRGRQRGVRRSRANARRIRTSTRRSPSTSSSAMPPDYAYVPLCVAVAGSIAACIRPANRFLRARAFRTSRRSC